MSLALAALVMTVTQQGVDPLRLPIGNPGEVRVEVGQIVNTATGKAATAADIAAAADEKQWVFLGENHATTEHQQLQADVIDALVKRGRKVAVGLEMYTRPKQEWLDKWSAGSLEEAEFLEKSEWKTQWGFGYEFYRPVFEVAKKNRLPMVALNVPRDWVRAVGREGYGALTAEQKAQLPAEMSLDNKEHRSIFNALMGGHPPTGPRGENIYAAQVLWDEGMADTAIKWLAAQPKNDKTVFVVVAGVGHIMYGQGINYRVKKRTGETGVTVSMSQAAEPVTVSKGLGDFVFVSKEKASAVARAALNQP